MRERERNRKIGTLKYFIETAQVAKVEQEMMFEEGEREEERERKRDTLSKLLSKVKS